MMRLRIALYSLAVLATTGVAGSYCGPIDFVEQAFRTVPVTCFLLFGWLVIETLNYQTWRNFIILVLSYLFVLIAEIATDLVLIRY